MAAPTPPLTRDAALDRLAEVLSGCNRAGDTLTDREGEPWPVPIGGVPANDDARAANARRFHQTRRALLEWMLTWRPTVAPSTPSPAPARPSASPPRPPSAPVESPTARGVVASLVRWAVGRVRG